MLLCCVLYTPGSSEIDSLIARIGPRTYSHYFVEALSIEAENDKDIVAVHAAMRMEPSIQLFQEKFPDRFFDVGMAEQHAVTFSAGLACGGLKPFCIIPSAFLQRAYDQVLPPFLCLSVSLTFFLLSLKASFYCLSILLSDYGTLELR